MSERRDQRSAISGQESGVRGQESGPATARLVKSGIWTSELWTPAALLTALMTIAGRSDDRVIVIAMAVIAAGVAVAYMHQRTRLKCAAIAPGSAPGSDDADVIEAKYVTTDDTDQHE
jgi:hypothetical protein